MLLVYLFHIRNETPVQPNSGSVRSRHKLMNQSASHHFTHNLFRLLNPSVVDQLPRQSPTKDQ
jgi:hypothetical protein